jgi:hypothetical protein
LYGFILDHIEKVKRQKEREKAAWQHKPRTRAAADRPFSPYRNTLAALDTLANKAAAGYDGHHARQVSFAGKVFLVQKSAIQKGEDYGIFTKAAALAYVKTRPDVFGNDDDTAKTISSVFDDNGGL